MKIKVCSHPRCGQLTTARDARCQTHRTYSPTYHQRDTAERQRRATAVAQWRTQHGNWCPGHGTPPHPATDLTADHTTPVTHGGINSPLQILCRTCNSRKRDTTTPPHA